MRPATDAATWGMADDTNPRDTVEGNWSSRWNGGADPTMAGDAPDKWKQGRAEVRIIGERIYLLFDWDHGARKGLRILELVKTRIPKRFGLNPIRDVPVLCTMNRGGVGVRSLNIELQAASNPAGEPKVGRFGWTFAPGDKVMQIENDYDKEVYNGDIGYLGDVDQVVGKVTVTFDGRVVTYGFGELDVLVPAYAATIHKSQGSEYPDAATQPALHRRHPREAPRRPGRPEEGGRHCSPQRFEQAALVETWGVALGERSPSVSNRMVAIRPTSLKS